ncbi:MAG: pyridoxamine 5'-phosphate oxidase family protein [Chloroflexi bacterium]|nr:pyridoxamine 5'-phosphate oxidase family protein [Chloroflexota bacterium]
MRTERTTAKRHPERSTHEFATIARILDEGIYCHIGFSIDTQPFVVPTAYGREGRALYIHGSAASRALRSLSEGLPLCLTVTLFDGLVLARSAFSQSINYRSVMILGVAHVVADDDKARALRVITEHVVPGRWADVRPPSSQELEATTVLKLDINEASAKIRSGPPIDDEEDHTLPCWAGELPFTLEVQSPVRDARLAAGVKPPAYLTQYRRPSRDGAASDEV